MDQSIHNLLVRCLLNREYRLFHAIVGLIGRGGPIPKYVHDALESPAAKSRFIRSHWTGAEIKWYVKRMCLDVRRRTSIMIDSRWTNIKFNTSNIWTEEFLNDLAKRKVRPREWYRTSNSVTVVAPRVLPKEPEALVKYYLGQVRPK